MRKEGFLIDIDYITVHENGKKRALVRLWCKSDSGEDFVIFDKTFEPYFYVFPRIYFEDAREEVAHADILRKKEIVEHICVRKGADVIKAKRVEICHRRIFGVLREGLRVIAEYPKDVPVLREAVNEDVVALEADILYVIRYMIDRDIRPFECITAECTASYGGLIASEISQMGERERALPPLRILAFDCEMAAPHGRMPSPKHDSIIIISCAFKVSESGIEGGEIQNKLFTAGEKEDDRRIISEFVEFVKEFRPDIIVGYNIDAFDWVYLRERARIHGIKLDIGKDGSELRIERSASGAVYDVDIAGILNVDLYKIARRDLVDVKVKTLENVAAYLGVMRKEDREHLKPAEIYDIWTAGDGRERLFAYATADALSALKIAEKLLPLQIELSRMLRHPLDLVVKMGRGSQVEALLTAEAFKRGEVIPPKRSENRTYEGAFVLPPVRGLHENVVSLDFSSMYPSIMVAFNISPDTFVPPDEVKNVRDVFIAPEVNHAFRKNPDGFFKQILRDLMNRRREIKRRMASVSSPEEYRMLDVQQQCIKILTNAFYGYSAWSGAHFYRRECAEATTAWGRAIIKRAIEIAENMGFSVIYGDTDSIFVKLTDRVKEKTIEMAKRLSAEISHEFPLDLEIKDFFKVIFFTGKKKRYAALTESGDIIVRGLEVRRGDWCELAKEVQSRVIEIILKRRNVEEAANYVKDVIKKLIAGEIQIEKLAIYKTLTKQISRYESEQAHVAAAKLAKKHNFIYETGSKIPYVIVEEITDERADGRGIGGRRKAGGRTSDRAFPIEIAAEIRGNRIILADGSVFHLDTDYYVRRQIIPAVMRVLQVFGYDHSYFEHSAQENLSRWM